jgi:hypothetical protein
MKAEKSFTLHVWYKFKEKKGGSVPYFYPLELQHYILQK